MPDDKNAPPAGARKPKIDPADIAEQHRQERLVMEAKQERARAEAEANALIEAQRVKQAAAKEAAELKPKIAGLRSVLSKQAGAARAEALRLRKQADAVDALAGDLEGVVITAGDSHSNPKLMVEKLTEAGRRAAVAAEAMAQKK